VIAPEVTGPAHRAHYELRVRCVLSPALLSYLGATPASTTAGRGTLVCLRANTALDMSEVFELLSANHVDVIDIRRL
jgi:hypothetical protein